MAHLATVHRAYKEKWNPVVRFSTDPPGDWVVLDEVLSTTDKALLMRRAGVAYWFPKGCVCQCEDTLIYGDPSIVEGAERNGRVLDPVTRQPKLQSCAAPKSPFNPKGRDDDPPF